MLINLKEIETEVPLVQIDDLNDTKLTSSVKSRLNNYLKSLDYSVDNYTSYYASGGIQEANSYSVIPNQYFIYASKLYEFATELYKYIRVFEELRSSAHKLLGSWGYIAENIRSTPSLSIKFEKPEDIELFAKFMDKENSEFRIGAKRLVNDQGVPRAGKDCFSSVILKKINLPDVTSAILGKLIYDLCGDNELYRLLKDSLIKDYNLPLNTTMVTESSIISFVYKTTEYLIQKDKFSRLHKYLKLTNAEKGYYSLVIDDIYRLTSIFKASDELLKESMLEYGGARRFVREPFVQNGYFYYLSTEWTCNTGSRLDLVNFKAIIEYIYDEYEIDISDEGYELRLKQGKVEAALNNYQKDIEISKPFLLLAGISGTGKTRFVREQAFDDLSNYQLVSVRPDWHEPSDLLGYVSRISGEEKYVTTDVLKFITKAWRELIDSGVDISGAISNAHDIKTTIEGSSEDLEQIPPYWLCLDEMNLAPVEQYFADYLSVSETRKWSWQGDEFEYCCDPLLTSSTINDLFDKGDSLREALELADSSYDELWKLFKTKGIAIPFNLMVAGTVNMDETTHGFSRKVIDRALSFDFGEFFPNDFQKFFEPDTLNLKLSYPVWSDGRDLEALSGTVDNDGRRTVNFLDMVNKSLVGTPFQLAFRALNEILLGVIANKPQTERELMAVWDDFVMCKLLPRIEGDIDKLSSSQDVSEGTILNSLLVVLQGQLGGIWEGDARPDLYREYTTEQAHSENAPQEQSPSKTVWIPCRSKHKLEWMQQRLEKDTFTSFWP